MTLLVLIISGCNNPQSSAPAISVPTCTTQDGTYFTLSGIATYDWIPANTLAEGGIGLGYSQTDPRPIRRAAIRAVNSAGAILVEGRTNDNGEFSINVPGGCGSANVMVLARSKASAYSPDGIGQESCSGASWDIRVVDNTQAKATHATQSTDAYSRSTSGISIHAATRYTSRYTNRSGAPFAILDTVISEMELVCQANSAQYFPLLYLNWSARNSTYSGSLESGQIGTSFFTTEGGGISNIYVLGEEDVDTDEYDDHVIAHEFGHYLEYALFRSDSIGGAHSLDDVLDPRVAFSEGYATAMAAMALEDPMYVDTNRAGQNRGFVIDTSATPIGNDRGVYSETTAQYLLWKLYENHRAADPNAGFERIYSVLKNFQARTAGFTTLLSFAAYFNQEYGPGADQLSTLWELTLKMPLNALCRGNCTGSDDRADPLDEDNDLGNYFAAGPGQRKYDGKAWGPEFWRLYRPVSTGVNASTAHEVTDWSYYSYIENKFGNTRWYRYVAPSSGRKTISVDALTGAACSQNVLDLFAYRNGILMNSNTDGSGCPSLAISTVAGETYLIEVRGQPARELSGWNITLSP